MKPGRQSIIMEIINEKDIETQNQLLEELAARGVKSTQATLSRDIRDMRLVKELGPNGNYRYAAASKPSADAANVTALRQRWPGCGGQRANSRYSGGSTS